MLQVWSYLPPQFLGVDLCVSASQQIDTFRRIFMSGAVDEVINFVCTRYQWTLNEPNWGQSGVECGVFWNTT